MLTGHTRLLQCIRLAYGYIRIYRSYADINIHIPTGHSRLLSFVMEHLAYLSLCKFPIINDNNVLWPVKILNAIRIRSVADIKYQTLVFQPSKERKSYIISCRKIIIHRSEWKIFLCGRFVEEAKFDKLLLVAPLDLARRKIWCCIALQTTHRYIIQPQKQSFNQINLFKSLTVFN